MTHPARYVERYHNFWMNGLPCLQPRIVLQFVRSNLSCLLAMGHDKHGDEEVLDIYRNLVWKLPRVPAEYWCCSAVTFLNGIAVIGGSGNDATLPLMDKNTWCFRRLCNMEPNGWYRLGSKNDLTLA